VIITKTISPEVHAWACNKYACVKMDFVGEAHCKVGTKYYPRYGDLAVGEEKRFGKKLLNLEIGFIIYEIPHRKRI
jgi:hypothetical protein